MKDITAKLLKYLDEKQAQDIGAYNVLGKSAETDLLVIATAKNQRHLKALADDMQEFIEKSGYPMRNREGVAESGWILLDFHDLILHLFDSEQRRFYSLERLWSSYPQIEIS